ncbi:hypothetical protein SARC_16160 [Sphaeroforma arctica JP610]|uniref:Ubiquitin-like domain-containing protein n=1 Tax=Sphaeroforma arctica JP610 TaxID=667725 RepID=A0A0L0F3I9_9EUKA|nr:hypothetical protein SARC_16160 [Sphaeroforma arctica JP610]KNC71300.1 hypothetical protein SARC_16160 [Sphaeroforma arctica JP610]|eukprot:XP_014145202.1 hypothetical protein SARC_16160 [Sphaeroforma arctica JP610]
MYKLISVWLCWWNCVALLLYKRIVLGIEPSFIRLYHVRSFAVFFPLKSNPTNIFYVSTVCGLQYLVDVPKKLPLSDAEAMSSIGITASDLQRAGEISGSMPAMQDNSMINIQIRDGRDSKTIILKFKKTDPMSKLHNYYCKKQGIAPSKVSFRFDGDKIKGSDTAEKLELEDDDLIDAIIS